ncbi:MAG: hypothetical protein EOP48_07905 [Sphingobacteriales bacterium]|nr:MAG: hypothetical protein EOP48_07905 [Sphingobacteriales bacterium]
MLNQQLKIYRKAYREAPSLRRRFRRKIAILYAKKLAVQDQLIKFNKPAVCKQKEGLEEVRCQLQATHGLIGEIQKRMGEAG